MPSSPARPARAKGVPVEHAIAAADLADLFEIFPSLTDAWEGSH